MPLPKPPIRNMTDFVVFAFVSVVVVILTLAVVSVIVAEVVNPDVDTGSVVNALLDITTTLIGALVGFIAGKGQGRTEVHEELTEMERLSREKREQEGP